MRLLIHIGFPKTATTSLQLFLFKNKTELASTSQIVYRPDSDAISHNGMEEAIESKDVDLIRFMVFGRELITDSKLTIISSENLQNLSRDQIIYLCEILNVGEIELMIGIRKPDSLILAWWKEKAKEGLQGNFPDFATDALRSERFFVGQILDSWKDLVTKLHIYILEQCDPIRWFMERFVELAPNSILASINEKANRSMGLAESILTSKVSNEILAKDYLIDGNHFGYDRSSAQSHLYGLIEWTRPMFEYSKSYSEDALLLDGVIEKSALLQQYSKLWCHDFLDILNSHSNFFTDQVDTLRLFVSNCKKECADNTILAPTKDAENNIVTSSVFYSIVRILESALASSQGLTHRSASTQGKLVF